jgi:hypothetical protein
MIRTRDINAIKTANHNTLASVGAANGIGNRARTMRSAKEKANCPRNARRAFRAERWG